MRDDTLTLGIILIALLALFGAKQVFDAGSYPRTIAGKDAVNADYWQSMGASGGSSADGDSITFPVLVIGPDDYIKEVTLSASDGDVVDSIYVEFFNMSWVGEDNPSGESKGRYRINGGSWIEINNTTGRCVLQTEREHGCLSIFPTNHVYLPASGVVDGNNTVEFQYRFDPNVTAASHGHGYRIYDLAWVEDDGDLQRDYVWVEEDPEDWTMPPGSDVAAGRAFFTDTTGLVRDGFGETTTCIHCHSYKGSEFVWPGVDLALFNYEPQTIRQVVLDARPADSSEVWMQENADDVVAWILSLHDSLNARGFTSEFTSAGYNNADLFRPHSLMYQGCHVVNTDTMAVEFWAASGGLYTDWGHDCLLESDAAMQEYMFADTGGEISWKSSYIHVDSVANHRRLPTPIPQPAWNFWLPRNDPYEIWDGNSGRLDFTGSNFYNHWLTELPSTITSGTASDIERELNEFWTDGKDWNSLNLNDPGNFDDAVSHGSAAHLSIAQWQVSQTFGFYFFDKLEELAETVYGPATNAKTPHARSWLGSTSRVFFDVAPHISDGGGDVNIYGPDASFRDQYFDTVWYEQQCGVINSGNGNGAQFRPCDWKYTYGHIANTLRNYAGLRVGFRFTRMFGTAMQNGSNHGPEDEWMVRHLNPSQIFANLGGQKFEFYNMPDSVRGPLIQALMRSQMHFLYQYDSDDWDCVDSEGPSGGENFECPGTVLEMGSTVNGGDFDGLPSGFDQFRPDLAYYRALPVMEHLGIDASLIDTVARFIENMGWEPMPGEPPLSDWMISGAPVAQPSPTSPTNGATGVAINGTMTWGSVAEASEYDIQIDDDSGFGSPLVDTSTGSLSYAFSLSNDETYYWRVRGTNVVGDGPWSTTYSFTTTAGSTITDEDWATGGGRVTDAGAHTLTAAGILGTVPSDGELDGFGSFVDFLTTDTAFVRLDSLAGDSESIYRTFSLMGIVDVDSTEQFVSVEVVGNARVRLVSRLSTGTAPVVRESVTIADNQAVCLRIVRSGTSFTGSYKEGGTCSVDAGYTSFSAGAQTVPGASGTVSIGLFTSAGSVTDTVVAHASGFETTGTGPVGE